MLCALVRQGRCSLGLLVQLDLNYGALEEFGCRDDHFEEDGQIISRETKHPLLCEPMRLPHRGVLQQPPSRWHLLIALWERMIEPRELLSVLLR